ncbi:MAG TPA: response regulator [Terriglobales bacterium]|nr:response regulator [Terriglobales bacterium]
MKGPVLLVEDDPSDARLIQRAFGKMDSSVAIFRLTNGDEVVSYLSGEQPFDNRNAYPLPCVVLLDIKLPRRSGFEVLEWIRRHPSALNRLPIIMLTSSRHSVDINRAYDLGANSYLAKPDTVPQLEQMASEFQRYWLSFNESPDLHGSPNQLRRS